LKVFIALILWKDYCFLIGFVLNGNDILLFSYIERENAHIIFKTNTCYRISREKTRLFLYLYLILYINTQYI